MGEIQIRRAGADDAEAVAGLLGQLGYPTETAEVPARLERMGADGRAAVFLAQKGGRVVGLATAHVLSVLNRGRDVAWLTALVVDESARGTGVGRELVGAVEAFGRQAGCERLSVTTQEHRTDAHAFYTRLGFQRTGRRFGKVLGP
jgi:GNAT superfamily N-acetyltransferase